MVGVYLYASVERRPRDPRPSVAAADVPAALAELATRDDVNVLFILVDTLRAHRLHGYGYERETSPMLDHLAATGVRFARHRAQSSWTKCSMASLWTGLYPVRTGVLRHDHALAEEARLPAEILRDAGFRTAGLWRNGWVAPNFGFSQGFEVYHRPRPSPLPPSVRRENPAIRLEGSDVDILESAREFLRLHGQERWLLYLHMMDVHQYVYSKESALFGTGYSDIYDNSIRYVDGVIRAMMDELFRRGLLERTLVVVASDHGEAFGEHGREGHARDLYAEVTEVPFLLSFPFQVEPPGLTVTSMTQNVDIWPTVLDILDLPPLEDADGRSLLPAIVAAARSEHHGGAKQSTFAQLDQTWGRTREEPRPLITVTGAGHRLVYPSKDPERAELYQLASDPTERRNIAAEKPEMVARLRGRVDDYLASRPAPWGAAPSVELDDMMLNQLRALGYKVD
jgi:arylsulfatase A-like enzyme